MSSCDFLPSKEQIEFLAEAVRSTEPVDGLTHEFYRYPARFSPKFAKATIEVFSRPQDTVIDPFMGGGTVIVEAAISGRRPVGLDISPLATFITKVKTTPMPDRDLELVEEWYSRLYPLLNIRSFVERPEQWITEGYQRNINEKRTWRIRKLLELALSHVEELSTQVSRQFARCLLLKTGQWALDCRESIPKVQEFRKQLSMNLELMIRGIREFTRAFGDENISTTRESRYSPTCLNRSAIGIETDPIIKGLPKAKLVVTSPPYPGVHVLYHRWQVRGRRETPAPFWMADCTDGRGESFYTLGNRKQKNLLTYFDSLNKCFSSLAKVVAKNCLLVQLVAFSDPTNQLNRYLSVLERCGFSEIVLGIPRASNDGRIWRCIPNRKFYALRKSEIPTTREVFLLHRLQ